MIIFTKASVNKLQCVWFTYSQHLAVVNNIDYVTWTKVFRGCMEHSHNRSFICVLKQTSRTKLWMASWSKCKFLHCLYQIILKWQIRIVKNRESRLGNLIFWAIWLIMHCIQPHFWHIQPWYQLFSGFFHMFASSRHRFLMVNKMIKKSINCKYTLNVHTL